MFQKFVKNTLDPQLSMKTIPCGKKVQNINQKLKNYFLETFEIYEKLFQVIKNQSSFYQRPEPLRHPLIFYYGHTASFYINKMIDKGILKKRVNQKFQRTFAVGVDQNDWDDLDQAHYKWPSLSQTQQYRNMVKNVILSVIQSNKEEQINWQSQMWILLMAIDHQRLHLQTSAVIIRRLPPEQVKTVQWLKQCPFMRRDISRVPLNYMKTVPMADIIYDRTIQKAEYYGWDSEFGKRRIKTKQFKASKMLVSNAQFLQFYLDKGYQNKTYWTEQGKKWLQSTRVVKPVFWVIKDQVSKPFDNYYLKTLTSLIKMPWDWPVQVNNLEARAFCNWKSEVTGKKLRLPTEDEYFALRNLISTDVQQWKYQSVGNINLQFWCSPCPVDMFQIQGFCDILGNVLQHTITPIYPFQNFKIHPLYEDFTTPSFDQRHDLIKGGSFINTGNSASLYYRTGFRRHFYLFTGFRYVESDNPTQVCGCGLDQSDKGLQKALKIHFIEKNSYINQVLDYVNKINFKSDIKSLVVGCSVGRLPLQFSKYVDKSFGIDYTARYFQLAARLVQKGSICYKNMTIQLSKFNLNNDLLKKIRLYQMHPQNTDNNKINDIDFMVIDGFNIKAERIISVMKSCFRLLKQGQQCYSLILIPSQNSYIKNISEQLKQMLAPQSLFLVKDQFQLHNQESNVIGKASLIKLTLFSNK